MRKNYFAKKFVAYSMAFAVAFSTLTVSPVFVKEAKAAAPTAIAKELADNMYLVDDITSTVAGVTPTLQDVANNITGATIDPAGSNTNIFEIDFTKAATYAVDGKTQYPYENVKFDGVTKNGKVFQGATATDISTNVVNYMDFSATTDVAELTATTVSDGGTALGDIDLDNLNGSAVTSGGKYQAITWYKLKPIHGKFTKETGIVATPTTTVSYNAYQTKKINPATLGDTTLNKKLTFAKTAVSSNDAGIYIAVSKKVTVTDDGDNVYEVGTDSVSTTIEKYDIFNVVEKSKLDASAERDIYKVAKGKDVTLAVNATSLRDDITYTWSFEGKTLDSTTNSYKVENVDSTKAGTYTCVVSDGAGKVVLNNIDVVVTNNVVNKRPVNYTTIVNGTIDTGTDQNKLDGGNVELISSVPTNDNFRYVWFDGANSPKISSSDVTNYSAKNNSIVIKDDTTTYTNKPIVCYTLTKEDYENLYEDIWNASGAGGAGEDDTYTSGKDTALSDLLTKLENATNDVEKNNINKDIRALEVSGSAKLKDKATKNSIADIALYKETFVIKKVSDKTVKSVNLVKEAGDSVSFTAPTADEVRKANGCTVTTTTVTASTAKFSQSELTADDFGVHEMKTTLSTCGGYTGHANATHDMTVYYNVIYKSDLTASAEKAVLTEKVGAQNVELKVNASSKLPLDYTWSKDSGAALPNNKTATYKISEVKPTDIYVPEKLNELGKVATPDSQYYLCKVTNGLEDVTIKVLINEEKTFEVYEKKPVEGTQTTNVALVSGGPAINVKAVPGKKLTLSPYVVANGATLTYKWYNISNSKDILSTTDSVTVDYKEPATYACVISDGTKVFNLRYSVDDANVTGDIKLVLNKEIEDQIYTGKEIIPELEVIFIYHNTVTDTDEICNSRLVKDVDYKAEFIENVNVGEARVKITPIGLYTGKTITEKFYINRADNSLEIADKTVVLGSSVQPKTVKNTAKATLSYAYFTDAECTNEIEVPSKVGTYYVKATSAATLNYKEATSNVATVKVVPGKVKMLGTSRTASSVKLNWTKATGATSYRVYYKAPGAKSYKVFKNTTATSMNVTGLASATTYTFAVKAYAKTAGYSTVYATKKTTTAPAKVAKPTVTAGSKKATVKFTKVARATGYQVYMAKGNGSYKKVATTKSLSFTKTGLAKGATYKFKVRAYKTVGSNTYYGAFSSAKAVKVK